MKKNRSSSAFRTIALKTLAPALLFIAPAVLAPPAVADIFVSGNHSSILRFDDNGNFLGQFSSGGAISNGRGVIFGPDGNLYVSSFSSDNVQRFDGQSGAFIDNFVTAVNGPWELTFGPDGNLYVVSFQSSVERFDGQSGAPLGTFATSAGASGLTFGPDGNLYVGNFGGNRVDRFDGQTGAFIDVFASGHGINIPTHFASTPPACPEDLDGSGAVDFGDLLAILSAWGNAGGPEDLDGSGTVDFGDLLVVLANWGPCP